MQNLSTTNLGTKLVNSTEKLINCNYTSVLETKKLTDSHPQTGFTKLRPFQSSETPTLL